MKRLIASLIVGSMMWMFLIAPTFAQYDVYKNSQDGTPVPDVDKAGVPPPPGAAPGDKSCWEATAANLLAGAGWGLVGNTAQQNATLIYGHMTNHFGIANQGQADLAINWWLYNYGYNSNKAAQGWYRPSLTYNDVTSFNGGPLTSVNYDYLLNELTRCQYVGVKWVLGGSSSGDHCMTLVGGNTSANANPVSVWHDSDRDNPGVPAGDDPYANLFAPVTGAWSLPGYITAQAVGYVTLCPGLQKPDAAMRNYDAAYYKDQDPLGNVSKVWRLAGTANYGQPAWSQDPENQDQWTILTIPNEPIPDMQKIVSLLVDYRDRPYDPAHPELAPDIVLKDEQGQVVVDRLVEIDPDGGQVKYTWTIDHQPPFEQLVFPTEEYYFLSGDIKDFNLATMCVPEPATYVLLLAGAIAWLIVRRRKRA